MYVYTAYYIMPLVFFPCQDCIMSINVCQCCLFNCRSPNVSLCLSVFLCFLPPFISLNSLCVASTLLFPCCLYVACFFKRLLVSVCWLPACLLPACLVCLVPTGLVCWSTTLLMSLNLLIAMILSNLPNRLSSAYSSIQWSSLFVSPHSVFLTLFTFTQISCVVTQMGVIKTNPWTTEVICVEQGRVFFSNHPQTIQTGELSEIYSTTLLTNYNE